MRKNWMLVIFVLILTPFASAGPFAQEDAPPQQGGAVRQQMRGPAPPVPGPPHDPHDLAGVWDGRRGYGGATFRGPAPELTEWGQQQLKLAKPSNNGAYSLKETNDPILTTCLPPGTPPDLPPAGSDAGDTGLPRKHAALRA